MKSTEAVIKRESIAQTDGARRTYFTMPNDDDESEIEFLRSAIYEVGTIIKGVVDEGAQGQSAVEALTVALEMLGEAYGKFGLTEQESKPV